MNSIYIKLKIMFIIMLTSINVAWCGTTASFQIIQEQFIFDSSTVEKANISMPNAYHDSYAVEINLKKAASDKLEKLTQENIGKKLNFVLNGKIISSAIIHSKLPGQIQITGFTKRQAENFVNIFYQNSTNTKYRPSMD